jgi:hypothetical protein
MKKNLFILIIVIGISSCSKDDDNSSQSSQSIYGKWYYKETVIDNTTYPYDDHEPCGKDYIEFYDTNKIKGVDVWDCEEDIDWIGTFTKSNNSLTISNGIENRVVEIIELNSTSLSYKYFFDENGDGINESYIEKFTRQ